MHSIQVVCHTLASLSGTIPPLHITRLMRVQPVDSVSLPISLTSHAVQVEYYLLKCGTSWKHARDTMRIQKPTSIWTTPHITCLQWTERKYYIVQQQQQQAGNLNACSYTPKTVARSRVDKNSREFNISVTSTLQWWDCVKLLIWRSGDRASG